MDDVATYAALCGLATFDRDELKSKIIDNRTFKGFLELVPEVCFDLLVLKDWLTKA